ncbi:PA2169 family four-helix-bundle protein [Flavobacterium silvaticum]|uniref:PA2169 family four-helix-bundle protein n=1 Tax=Flavobacterium silvaticum TaxID=1852020 RepID=A0A972FUC8_9FLAO|nr:PA2169 family four-helix-bundle protein [Flavobacterium silvaticum]NMH27755.1 PA2169 family four-helix-bundle protein [Flavobacterium silvaticum]
MSTSKTVSALNDLIEINNDRIEGYKKAMKETDDSDLKRLFAELSITSEKNLSELLKQVYGLGGTPEEGTRATGKLFRAWMDLKAAVTGNDKHGILSSCEFGEDKAQEAYEAALEDESLTPEQRSMVQSQKTALRADHDKVKALRDANA